MAKRAEKKKYLRKKNKQLRRTIEGLVERVKLLEAKK